VRTLRRGACFALAVVATMLVAAPEAGAHATLVTTNPANDAVVAVAPARVVLQFDEPVETAFGSVRVFDANGSRVDGGALSRPSNDSVAVTIGRTLARGTYTVAWRAISADTHPVHGAFVFSVGAASGNAQGIAAKVLQEQATPRSTSVGFGVVRFLAYALLLLAGGGAVALVTLGLPERRLASLLAAAAALLVPVSLAGIVLQGAVAGGYGLGRALSWDVFTSVVDTRFGGVWLARAAVAAALAAVALARWRLPALVLGVGLLVTTSLAGHADALGGLTLAADMAHVVAAAIWTGGLAFVVLALLLARADRWPLAARVVPRFSAIAVGAVAVLLVAGVANGYLEVRSWHGLFSTTYGQLVVAKAALVVPLLVLGAYNNRYAVPRLRAQIASVLEQRRFLRAAAAELALVVAVVGVTAVLVSKPPPKALAAVPKGPYAATTRLGPYELNLVLDPARTGANAIHVYLLKQSGLPAAATQVTLAASLGQPAIGPIRLDTTPAGPGHFVGYATLPIAGDWQLRVEVRRGKFDQWASTLTMPIRTES
jgi:copper transport protein